MNQAHASTAGKIREYGLYDIALKKTGQYDYKPTDVYLAATGSDFSIENFVCEIASNKQIETRGFYNTNQNSIIDFKKIYNKNKVTLYCRKMRP